MDMDISVVIMSLIFLNIIIGKIGKFYIPMWQSMLGGAIFLIAIQKISFKNAWLSIRWEIIFFLIGMFIVGYALEKSGYLLELSSRILEKARSYKSFIFLITMLTGILSALLMNDTIAIVGTIILIHYSQIYDIPSEILLYLLAFSITTGSIFSPIGNPQNLLIALNPNFPHSFLNFILYLLIPTFLNLVILFYIFYKLYPLDFKPQDLSERRKMQTQTEDKNLYQISKISLLIILILLFLKIISYFVSFPFAFDLEWIAIIGAAFIILFYRKRWEILVNIDWHTILFFLGMFVVMKSVWDSGFFQKSISKFEINLFSIFFISTFLSQLISNVPLVSFFMSFIDLKPDMYHYLALAASSTFAGNLTVLGAASNIIIFQNAYQRGIYLSPWKFLRLGILITSINFFTFLTYFYLLKSILP